MKLSNYLETHKVSVREFADRTGVSVPTVYAWLSGRNNPNRRFMAKIHEATKGAVTANDFFESVAA